MKRRPHLVATAIVIKPLDAMHLVSTSEPADGFDVDFAPIFERLYSTSFVPAGGYNEPAARDAAVDCTPGG